MGPGQRRCGISREGKLQCMPHAPPRYAGRRCSSCDTPPPGLLGSPGEGPALAHAADLFAQAPKLCLCGQNGCLLACMPDAVRSAMPPAGLALALQNTPAPATPLRPQDWAARTALDIALGLAHLHTECRLVHRDVSTNNVLLVPDPSDPRGFRAKLSDFGEGASRAGAAQRCRGPPCDLRGAGWTGAGRVRRSLAGGCREYRRRMAQHSERCGRSGHCCGSRGGPRAWPAALGSRPGRGLNGRRARRQGFVLAPGPRRPGHAAARPAGAAAVTTQGHTRLHASWWVWRGGNGVDGVAVRRCFQRLHARRAGSAARWQLCVCSGRCASVAGQPRSIGLLAPMLLAVSPGCRDVHTGRGALCTGRLRTGHHT